MPLLGILLLLLGFVAFGVYAWRQDQKRRRELSTWAMRRNWRFFPDGIGNLSRVYSGLKLLDKGHSRRNRNVVRGEVDGRPVLCLDYRYVTGSGKHRTTHTYGVVIVETGFPTIPLLIRRENTMDRLGEFLGADDIDFESAEFSRRFYVKSADRKWAYDIIHGRTMEYLMGAPAVSIEFGFGEIAVYSPGWNGPDDHEQALAVAREMLALVPEYVIKQMKGEPR